MSSPRIGGEEGLIEQALRDLDIAFAASSELWRDQSREGFVTDHLDPLRQRAKDAVRTIREIEATLREVVRLTHAS